MNFSDMTWRRKFSMNMYKSLRLPMSKMTFTSDFTKTERGDLYPLLSSAEDSVEHVSVSGYSVRSGAGTVERFFSSFFPYANYRIKLASLFGSTGFHIKAKETAVKLLIERDEWEVSLVFIKDGNEERVKLQHDMSDGIAVIVAARPGFFDVYSECGDKIKFIHTFEADTFKVSNRESFYKRTEVRTSVTGEAVITEVDSFLDCGVGQADIRPFRYENGDIVTEDGRVFLTFSARMEAGGYQGVLSWLPGTADFKLVGTLFYDTGKGITHGDVASAYVLDRRDNKWHLWQRSGGAGHVLAYSTFDHDVRYGINIIDVKALPFLDPEKDEDTAFLGKKGDEDPDFIYDETRGKWLFALCRLAAATKKYQYYFYESDRPDSGYEYIGEGPAGEETGGSIVKLDGKTYFVCGNSFSETSSYRVYEWGKFDTFTKLSTDFPDGGFRGWGTVMPICRGTRRSFFWLTFDRVLHSSIGFNWSYGNVYCFEAEEYEIL